MREQILKLAADAVIKPWGLVHGEALAATGIRVGLGELWLASAQTGPGNYASQVVEPKLGKDLAALLSEAASKGDDDLGALIGPRALALLTETPHRGKTEAWHVRRAVGRAGFAAGPRTAAQKDALRKLLTGPGLGADIEEWPDDVRDLFGLIEPVHAGEVYLVPAGTLHTMFAIGRDSYLVIDEIQQGYGRSLLPTLSKVLMVQDSLLSVQVHPSDETVRRAAGGEWKVGQDLESNPTVRIYDFGRRPGEAPQLGFELTDVAAGLRRVSPLDVEIAGGTWQVLVACKQFVKSLVNLDTGARVPWAPVHGSYRVIHCTGGEAELTAGDARCGLAAGETAFVPGALEGNLRVQAIRACELFDDAVPDIAALRSFLIGSGAPGAGVDALLTPPRAFRE